MTPALIQFVRLLGGEGGVVAVGLPDGPSLVGMHAIDEDGARALAEAARTDRFRDLDDVPAMIDLEGDDLAHRTVVAMAGRDAGWQFPDLLDVLPHLVRATARVVVVARPASIAGSPDRLAEMLRSRGIAPFLTGFTPRTDPVAPGCSFAIIDPGVASAGEALVGAVVRCGDELTAASDTLRWLAAEGFAAAIVADGAAGIAENLSGTTGVIGAFPDAEVAFDALAASGVDWVLDLVAGERVRAAFPDRSIAESLAIISALGHGEVRATIVDDGPPLEGHESGAGYWRFAPEPEAFGRVVARRAERGETTTRSPYNLVLIRPVPNLPLDAWGVNREPLGLLEERGVALVERLSGCGVFDLTFPNPVGLRWHTEESIVSWHGNVLKAGVGRLPYPDPMAPEPGACLIRWDTIDGSPASLTVRRGDGPERFIARGGSGTVTIDGLQLGVKEVLRLTSDTGRRPILGEMALWFEFEPGP